MNKLLLSVAVLSLCLTLPAQNDQLPKFSTIEPKDLKDEMRIQAPSKLVDVREFFEYRKSRIKGAVNIPASGNLEFAADTLNKNLALFLYCTTGFRSSRVCQKFADKGFRKIYNLDGGLTAWKKEGLPVEKHRIRR